MWLEVLKIVLKAAPELLSLIEDWVGGAHDAAPENHPDPLYPQVAAVLDEADATMTAIQERLQKR